MNKTKYNVSAVYQPDNQILGFRPFNKNAQALGLAALSAVFLSLAFFNFNLECFAWIGFAPLFFALDKKNNKQSFLLSYFCGFLFFAISMHWIIQVTLAGWLALCLYQAIYFGIFGIIFSKKQKTGFLSGFDYVLLSCAWVVFEYIRSYLGGGLGWNLLGYSQYKNTALIQAADITGVWGISFLVIFMNIALYNVIKMSAKCYTQNPFLRIKSKSGFVHEVKQNPFFQTLLTLILFIAVLIYGHTSLYQSVADGNKTKINISVLQGNIPQHIKWDMLYKQDILDVYSNLSLQVLESSPDLIIWPETSVPGLLNYEDNLLYRVMDIAEVTGTNLLVGAPMLSGYANSKNHNSAVLFSAEGEILNVYNKLHLVPFGEFVPFEKYVPFLRHFLPLTGNYESGAEYTIFNIYNKEGFFARFGVLICFEDIFPDLARQFIKRGSDFLINITNDAWFGNTSAAYQHAAASVFRAIENRCFVVRSANTGLSCFIDKTGRIYSKVSIKGRDLFVRGTVTDYITIEKIKQRSFYTLYGDVFVGICAFLLIISIIINSKLKSL